MDIDYLAKMVKDLLLDNDRVALPGFGSFVAEMAPSVFSDKGYTINPPYRKLSFRENLETDDLLVRYYAGIEGTDEAEARKALSGFVSELREVLNRQKTIIFPGLGRLRATKENNYFFVSDEDMDIYPDGIGLEPVSLKAHANAAEHEPAAIPAGEGTGNKAMEEEEDNGPDVTDAGTRPQTVNGNDIQEQRAGDGQGLAGEKEEGANGAWKMHRKVKIALTAVAVAAALAIVALGIFVLLAHICPDFIDSLLYTEEELQILRS